MDGSAQVTLPDSGEVEDMSEGGDGGERETGGRSVKQRGQLHGLGGRSAGVRVHASRKEREAIRL